MFVAFCSNQIFSQKDTISSKVIGKWALTSYTQCLNCLTPEAGSAIPFKKRSVKINDKNGIYYLDFQKDSTVLLIFRSKKMNCIVEGKWYLRYASINIILGPTDLKRFLSSETDGGDPCRRIFYDLTMNYVPSQGYFVIDPDYLSETQMGLTQILYNLRPYGWSTYKKVNEIPLPKKQ